MALPSLEPGAGIVTVLAMPETRLFARGVASVLFPQLSEDIRMRRFLVVITVFLAVGAFCGSDAMAKGNKGGKGGAKKKQGNHPPAASIFDKLDKNNDGRLTVEEFKVGTPPGTTAETAEKAFKALDKNGDGLLNRGEFTGQTGKNGVKKK